MRAVLTNPATSTPRTTRRWTASGSCRTCGRSPGRAVQHAPRCLYPRFRRRHRRPARRRDLGQSGRDPGADHRRRCAGGVRRRQRDREPEQSRPRGDGGTGQLRLCPRQEPGRLRWAGDLGAGLLVAALDPGDPRSVAARRHAGDAQPAAGDTLVAAGPITWAEADIPAPGITASSRSCRSFTIRARIRSTSWTGTTSAPSSATTTT